MGIAFRLDVATNTPLDPSYHMNPFPNLTWENGLRLVVDSFLIGVGWSAGCWMFGQLMGLPWIRRGASKQ